MLTTLDPLTKSFDVTFPTTHKDLDQDEEYCFVTDKNSGKQDKIRFHEYSKIYQRRGLYEYLFYKHLQCCSPRIVVNLLRETMVGQGVILDGITALDLGAGNGMVGARVKKEFDAEIVGIDILPEARDAALRDRPHVYETYHAVDLLNAPQSVTDDLKAKPFNMLTSVAAMGFGDIPPAVFATAFNLIDDTGWIAFNIRDKFISNNDGSGFAKLIQRMRDEGLLNIKGQITYRHRKAFDGTPLMYTAFAGTKHGDIPHGWF